MEKRTQSFVYLSEDEKDTIEEKAIEAGLNFSQFVRFKMLEVCRENEKTDSKK